MKLLRALPPTHSHHYTNPASQGAFVCATKDWPVDEHLENCASVFPNIYDGFVPSWCSTTKPKVPTVSFGFDTYEATLPVGVKITSSYSDRLPRDRYDEGRRVAGTGCQGWCQVLKVLNDWRLKEFAAAIFGMQSSQIYAVRVIHSYNVSTGYSCPITEILYYDKA